MTAEEFRAWLEGFEAGIDAAPEPWQWAAIRARIDEIGATPLLYKTFVERFVEPYRQWWRPHFFCELGGLDSQGHYMDKMKALRKAGEIQSVAVCFEAPRGETPP